MKFDDLKIEDLEIEALSDDALELIAGGKSSYGYYCCSCGVCSDSPGPTDPSDEIDLDPM